MMKMMRNEKSADETSIYYLKERILLYDGCNLVAEIIKNHRGEIIETRQIQHHCECHLYHPIPPTVSNSSSHDGQEKDDAETALSRKRKRRNLDQQQVVVEYDHHQENPAKNTDFLALVTRKARTPRREIIKPTKTPLLINIHQQQNNININDHHDQEMIINNNNDDDQEEEEEEEEEEGRGILFIEKALRSTDVSDHHHRLSVSCKQAINDTFLTNEELQSMKNRGAVNALLTDPAGREYEIRLQIEKTGTGCLCYKIPKPWNQIRKDNHIEEGMIIQLWAFRPNNGLCFHLVCRT